MSNRANFRTLLGRFARNRAGASAVEFALTAPILALIILGVIAVGFEVNARIDAREAVRAGAHAVMAGVEDPVVIRQVVLDALDASNDGYSVQVELEFRCGTVVVGEDAACDDGEPPQTYYVIDLDAAAGAAYVDAPPISANIEVRVT